MVCVLISALTTKRIIAVVFDRTWTVKEIANIIFYYRKILEL